MDSGLLLLLACIGGAAVIFSPQIRQLAGAALVLGLLVGAYSTFIRTARCDGPCQIPLSPTWAAATCWSSGNAAIAKRGGRYYLVSDSAGVTSGACLDWRAWKPHAGDPF